MRTPQTATAPLAAANLDSAADRAAVAQAGIYLPFVFTAAPKPQELPEGDNNGCPCGWFDGYGRMFDYIPPPQ